MGSMKIKLDFNAMINLMTELTESEILAISLMAAGQEMTETVKKSDLVSIITLLMRKLNWVVDDKEVPGVEFEIEKNIENHNASSTNDCPENTANSRGVDQKQSDAMDVISEERNTKPSEQSSVAAVLISEGANTQNLAIESGYSSGPTIYTVVQTSTESNPPDQKAKANCTSLHKDQKDLPFGCNLCGEKFFKERHWEYHVLLKHRNGML